MPILESLERSDVMMSMRKQQLVPQDKNPQCLIVSYVCNAHLYVGLCRMILIQIYYLLSYSNFTHILSVNEKNVVFQKMYFNKNFL